MAPVDALLLVSFGGPEGPDDVVPFLRNVTRGRDIPEERLREVGQHYFHFGGVSPINAQNRALLSTLRDELPLHGLDLPVYWGNRNWAPYLVEALQQMRDDGVRRALAVFTSAYSSYSGCRQYRENLAAARAAVGEGAPAIERIGPYFNHAGFVDPFVDATVTAVADLDPNQQSAVRLVFTTHSIPVAMAESSGVPGGAYVRQHLDVAAVVATRASERVGRPLPWDLVYQSRSGAPHVPWLEPDIDGHLRTLAEQGCTAAVVVPVGFVSDHVEVLWDLDTQARAAAAEVGLPMVRVPTPGTDPRFVSMLAELALEHIEERPPGERPRLGDLPASPDRCALGCCPNPRGPLPAVGGDDPPGTGVP
jgi:protoporphyrin/coproporphyrin ferrochelatase